MPGEDLIAVYRCFRRKPYRWSWWRALWKAVHVCDLWPVIFVVVFSLICAGCWLVLPSVKGIL